MRDVETQLREYFDAAVERVTVEDVFARKRVAEQPRSRRVRWDHRPAWAAAAGFVATLFVLGGSLILGAAVRRPGLDAGGTPIAEAVSEATPTASGWSHITQEGS